MLRTYYVLIIVLRAGNITLKEFRVLLLAAKKGS